MQAVCDAGVEEDQTGSNLHLVGGTLTLIGGLISHFHPTPFPENKTILIACVLFYLVITGALALYAHLVQQGHFFTSRPRGGVVVKARSELPRFGEEYALTLEAFDAHGKSLASAKLARSVGTYFLADGCFMRPRFAADAQALLASVHAKAGGR